MTESAKDDPLRLTIPSDCHRLGLAFSGGGDSVALFHLLIEQQIHFTALHFNHGIVGENGGEAESFVRTLCAHYHIPLEVGHGTVKPETGLSLEMAAREARYTFFAKQPIDALLLAHHADDLAEHILLRFARGCGSAGLSALRPDNTVKGIRLLRPLLQTARQDLPNHPHIEDSSNTDTSIQRNAIRALLVDLPDVRRGLAHSAELLREEDDLLEQLTDAHDQRHADGSLEIPPTLHPAIQRRLLLRFLGDDATFDRIERLRLAPDCTEMLSPRRTIIKQGQHYTLKERHEAVIPEPLTITQPGHYQWGDYTFIVTETQGFIIPTSNEATLFAEPFTIRGRTIGERFHPFGLQGSRKLQDIYVDIKIPCEHRSTYPLIIQRNVPAWIPKYRTASHIRITPEQHTWRITIHPCE